MDSLTSLIFNSPVSDEVISGGQKVTLDVGVGEIVDDLRRGVGLMRRNVGRLWTFLKIRKPFHSELTTDHSAINHGTGKTWNIPVEILTCEKFPH